MADLTAQATNLNESARIHRQMLLQLPTIGIADALQYMTARPGITFEETAGTLHSGAQLRPYNGDDNAQETAKLVERTLKTFLGSCVERFEPNSLRSTVWAQLNGHSGNIKNSEMSKAMLMSMMKSVLKNLNKGLFGAVRKADGTTTADLFDGFDTITAKEITKGNIAADKGNLLLIDAITKTNAVDILKDLYFKASDELQSEQTILYVPRDVFNAYNEDYQQTVGATPYNRQYKQTFLEGSADSCIIAPLVSKKGSDIIQLTTKDNMLYGYGNGVEKERIEVAKSNTSHFKIDFILEMFFGVNYQHIEAEKLMIAKYKA